MEAYHRKTQKTLTHDPESDNIREGSFQGLQEQLNY